MSISREVQVRVDYGIVATRHCVFESVAIRVIPEVAQEPA